MDTGESVSILPIRIFAIHIICQIFATGGWIVRGKNFTRFLILKAKTETVEGANKASMCFEVRNEAGSLADVLTIFKNHTINLTKIQSIPIIGKPSEYSIHIDVEWKKRKDYDKGLQTVLRQVRNLNVLGEYKKGKIEYR